MQLNGSNDVVSGSDVTVGLGSNVSGDTVAGDSDSIAAAAGDSFAVNGSSDNVSCFVAQVEMAPGDSGDTVMGDNDAIGAGSGDTFAVERHGRRD